MSEPTLPTETDKAALPPVGRRGSPLTVPVGGKLSVVVGQAYDRRRRALLSEQPLMSMSAATPRSWRALPAPIRLLVTLAVADVLVTHERGEGDPELIMTGVSGRVAHIATPGESNLVPLCGRRTSTEEGWQQALADLPLCGSCADAAVDGVIDQRPLRAAPERTSRTDRWET